MIVYNDFLRRLQNARDYGRYIAARCPFHKDSSPSLLVFKDGYFKCLGCNRAGHWKMLWDKLEGQPIQIHPDNRMLKDIPRDIDEYRSLEDLCYQAHEDLLKFTSWQWYLEMRGLKDTIEIAEIGYHRGWYTFPVRDENGLFVTAVFRAAPTVQQATGARYYCHHTPIPYVPDWGLVRRSKYIAVVYGILDALTLNKLRIPVMTTTAGKNSFRAEWLDEYRVPVYIFPDEGEETDAQELSNQLVWRGHVIRLKFPRGKKDPNGFLEAGREQDLLNQIVSAVGVS